MENKGVVPKESIQTEKYFKLTKMPCTLIWIPRKQKILQCKTMHVKVMRTEKYSRYMNEQREKSFGFDFIIYCVRILDFLHGYNYRIL